MHTTKYNNYPLTELETLLDEWLEREDLQPDPDFRQEWVAEGIELNNALLRKRISNEQKSTYYHSLAGLYLEYGRSEKIIAGNDRTAFRHLQKAAQYNPDKADIFYHLAFLAEKMTSGSEKWESAAFYAKEALERGIKGDKEIKIWCLLGKAYLELRFRTKAEECFRKSKALDRDDDFSLFRVKYSKKAAQQDPFARLKGSGSGMSRRTEREAFIEKSRLGQCFVLETTRHGSILHGNDASMPLSLYHAELLKLFIEFKQGLTKQEILNNTVTDINTKNEKSIKTDISRLRAEIKKGLEVKGDYLIQTVGRRGEQKYIWNPEIEVYIFEKR
jgi:tetratricopeptide (TPR) repeat protein